MIMAKKPALSKSERTDPKKNKSLAIRLVLKKKPNAKASEVAAAVKKEYGHTINSNHVYMIKTKANMASDGRPRKTIAARNDTPLTSPALWVDAIKTARQLLKVTGSLPNAIAILKAMDS
jgi:hypothetical protein